MVYVHAQDFFFINLKKKKKKSCLIILMLNVYSVLSILL